MDPVLHALARFGHTAFRPGQEELVRALVSGRDALGLLPTGGGKSLTYLLPAVLLDRPVLVVSPLVALMTDQLRRAREVGLAAEALAGPMPRRAVDGVLARMRAGTLDLVLVAPERLAGPRGAEILGAGPGALVVDEAHCLIQWGYDFRPDYRVLEGLGPARGLPVLALTATATPEVKRALIRVLGLRRPVTVQKSFDRPNLSWHAVRVRSEEERWRGLWAGVRATDGARVVYAGARGLVERLARALRARGLRTGAYHAGLPAEVRSGTQDAFLAGDVDVLVATNAFGMGVDKADIRAVIHWSPPGSLEAYYQEAGRGGRDGEPASARVLWHPDDRRLLRARLDGSHPHPARLLRVLVRVAREGWPADVGGWDRLAWSVRGGGGRDAGETLRRAVARLWDDEPPVAFRWPPVSGWARAWRARQAGLRRLAAVHRYLRDPGCLRRRLVAYFGERLSPEACGCEACAGVPPVVPVAARSILNILNE
jgi:ATP-dependent DNA helicase RecQ